jgi:hypothetical protein
VGHSTQFKKVPCDSCNEVHLTEATHLDDGSRALLVPIGWRLIYKGGSIGFRCPTCWGQLPTGEYKLKPKESVSGDSSLVLPIPNPAAS